MISGGQQSWWLYRVDQYYFGYILRLNLQAIEAGVSLNCDWFSVVPGVDEYFSLLIFLHFFCLEVYLLLFFICRRAGGIGGGIIYVETNPSIIGIN